MIAIQIAQAKPSNNIWIDGLLDGEYWNTKSLGNKLQYSLIDSSKQQNSEDPPSPYKSYPWSKLERRRIEESLSEISNTTSLQFENIGENEKDAQLKFHLVGRSTIGSRGGFAYAPDSSNDFSGIAAINREFYNSPQQSIKKEPLSGSFYGFSFLHEISHSLGLKHPHDSGRFGYPKYPGIKSKGLIGQDKGKFGQNSHPYTQMTYTTDIDYGKLGEAERKRDFGFLKTLGALDIAAMQWLYGINPTHAIEDNSYILPKKNKPGTGWTTIWDTGGTDQIDGSDANEAVTIDLRNANLGDNNRAGGHISAIDGVMGGFTIAHDWDGKETQNRTGLCIIENATGGSHNDKLRGNLANNQLEGNAGDDQLSGGNGNDTLIGGRGKDVLKGGPGADQFVLSKDMADEIQDFSFDEGDSIMYGENELKRRRDLKIIESTSNFEETDGFILFRDSGELFLSETNRSEHEEVNIQTLIAVLTTNNLP